MYISFLSCLYIYKLSTYFGYVITFWAIFLQNLPQEHFRCILQIIMNRSTIINVSLSLTNLVHISKTKSQVFFHLLYLPCTHCTFTFIGYYGIVNIFSSSLCCYVFFFSLFTFLPDFSRFPQSLLLLRVKYQFNNKLSFLIAKFHNI